VWRPTVKCPACGTVLPNEAYHAGQPWVCPGCGRQYRIARPVLFSTLLLAIGFSIVGCYLAGLRGLRLLISTLIVLIPVDLMCIYVRNRLMPLTLEPFPSDSPKDSRSAASSKSQH
jgi:hypothetical protein